MSWEQFEARDVGWSHGGEVAPVEGGYLGYAEPLGNSYDRGVNDPESEIGISLDQLDHSGPIGFGQVEAFDLTGSQ